MRIGKPVEHLQAAIKSLDVSDSFLKLTAVGRQIGYAVYLFNDMLVWLHTAKVRPFAPATAHKISQRAATAWFYGIVFSLASSLYKMYGLRARIERIQRVRAAAGEKDQSKVELKTALAYVRRSLFRPRTGERRNEADQDRVCHRAGSRRQSGLSSSRTRSTSSSQQAHSATTTSTTESSASSGQFPFLWDRFARCMHGLTLGSAAQNDHFDHGPAHPDRQGPQVSASDWARKSVKRFVIAMRLLSRTSGLSPLAARDWAE